MPVRALSPATRIIIGVLGAAGAVVALRFALVEARAGIDGDGMAWLAVAVLAVATFIALRVLGAAVRGTITIRER
jgi:hypothetical protein